MEFEKTIAELNKDVSHQLVKSIYLNEILTEIFIDDGKINLLLNQQKENLTLAFKENEECRRKIYID